MIYIVRILQTIIIAVIFLSSCRLKAQPACRVHSFSIRDGLASNTISGMTQGSNDLMWFSTLNGLSCFDGYSFTTFRDDRGQSSQSAVHNTMSHLSSASDGSQHDLLTSNRMLMVRPNKFDDLWCISYDRHLYLFDTHSCKYVDVGAMLENECGKPVSVRTIYSLPNGHTWVATLDGDANFCISDSIVKDGKGITTYSLRRHAFKGNTIHKVVLDSVGREWVFTEKGATIIGQNFDSNVAFDYLVSLDNTVLLASPDGVVATYRDGWNSARSVTLADSVSHINELVMLDRYRAVAATDNGLLLFDVRHSNEARIVSLSGKYVTSVFVDRSKRLWVFTKEQGVTLVDSRDWSQRWLVPLSVNPLLATSSDMPVFHQDQNGTVWLIPTGNTFCYYDEVGQCLIPYVLQTPGAISPWMDETEKINTDLPTITKYFSDRQMNLWFTGTRALTLVNFLYHRFLHSVIVPNQEARSVCVDHNGNTWIGMYTGELAFVDTQGNVQYLSSNGSLQPASTKFSTRIYSLFEDSKGRLWIGTKGEGLYVKTASGVKHYMHDDSNVSIANDNVYDFEEDRYGRIWIATYGGGLDIACGTDDDIRFMHPSIKCSRTLPKNLKIRRITMGGKGVILLSTNIGLVTMRESWSEGQTANAYISSHEQGDNESLLTSDVMQVAATSGGAAVGGGRPIDNVLSDSRRIRESILVVTQGGGIQEIVSENLLQDNLRMKRIEALNTIQSLPQSLVEDKDGNVWVVRESSIDRYNRKLDKVETFGPHELGDRIRFSEALPVLNPQTGELVLAVVGGTLTLRPSEMEKSDFCPQIVFTGIQYQGEETIIPLLNKKEIEVSNDHRNLTIYFSALDYTNNDQMQYAYKIEGEDEEWNYVGKAHSASFNHLPAGHLRLLVKSTNSDGVWMDNTKVLEINSLPTFWETWWAKLLYMLLFASMVALAVYIYRLHTRNRMERELSDMKTRFFTEISHKLRTPLTLIGGPVTEVLQKEQLADGSRNLLEMVKRNSERMLALVNRMLTYSREKEVYISDTSVVEEQESEGAKDSINTLILPNGQTTDSLNGQTLLIVEDNDDLRAFLVSILCEDYRVLQAANGQQGLEMAERKLPDFIITDVMMPVMDGLTMVHQIKQNKEICHIPIIVLSAKASMEDRLQGLREGIDDYITKPFSATYLKQRVENIVAGRRLLQRTYIEKLEASRSIESGASSPYQLETPQIVDADKDMMERLMAYLEENIGDADLRIEALADAVNLGRSVFYGKVKSIVGMTPIDFLRHLRIQRAEQLIVSSQYSFAQIAYSVGFSDPKYFSRCFKKETGMTPSEYRQKARQ